MQGGGATSSGPAAGQGNEIILQGFNWESHRGRDWYNLLRQQAGTIAAAGFSAIWLPPPSESVSPQGCAPRSLCNPAPLPIEDNIRLAPKVPPLEPSVEPTSTA